MLMLGALVPDVLCLNGGGAVWRVLESLRTAAAVTAIPILSATACSYAQLFMVHAMA